jgi:hypothetical protein
MGLLDITGISSVLDFGSKIIDRVWPDPQQAAAAKLELFKAQQAGEFKEMDQAFEIAKAQIGVNQTEAGNGSTFVSGWRPAIGWVCASALGYQYLLRPIISWGVAAAGHPLPPMPGLDDNLWQLMMGMLGLGGLRTFEKVKGASK